MAFYQDNAFGPPYKSMLRMQTGVLPIYLFGYRSPHYTPLQFQITNTALTTNVAAITVSNPSGGGDGPLAPPLVTVGQSLSVRATTASSGALNTNGVVTATTVDSTTGAGVISFALTHANITTGADSGFLVLEPYETPDLITGTIASIPVAQTFTPDDSDNARCLYAEAKWTGTLPTTATVKLQVANVDRDARYGVVQNAYGVAPTAHVAQSDALATVAGSAVTQLGAQYQYLMGKFIRAQVSGFTGGDTTTGLIVTIFA